MTDNEFLKTLDPFMRKRAIEITLEERGLDADQLGGLKAMIADKVEIADTIKARLIETAAEPMYGTRVFEGQLFRAVVTFNDTTNTNWKAIFNELIETSDDTLKSRISSLINKHTNVTPSVPSVRTYARKG